MIKNVGGLKFFLQKVVWIITLCLCFSYPVKAQYSLGSTGLLNIPTADMNPDGTFMAGVNYLPQNLTPQVWNYDTGNLFLNITFLSWVEVAFRNTLLKLKYPREGKWNFDRSLTLRIRPLKEAKWYPSIVIGSNDVITTGQLNPLEKVNGNRFFSSVYGVITKHFDFNQHNVGITVGGNIPIGRNSRQGVFGGISYTPAFFKNGSLMVDYDDSLLNIGVAVKWFNHLSTYLFCSDFKAISGGIRYELGLLKKRKQ